VTAAIEVKHLIKIYKNISTPAVNDISFVIPEGIIFGLLGPNGAGKTTTISVLCGLIQPTSGDVHVHNLSVKKKSGGDQKNHWRCPSGYCPLSYPYGF
jgi:ABC-2 type transport system ATP-binding protein